MKNNKINHFIHWQTAWFHLRRSPYQAVGTILILTLSLYVLTVFVLIGMGAEKTLQMLESQPQVIGFFSEPPELEDLESLRVQLQGIETVTDLQYVSQEDALKKYQDDNKDDPLLLEMVTAEILPASIEVSTAKPEDLQQVAEILNLYESIDEVIYQRDVVDQLIKWTKFLRSLGVGLVTVLSMVAFFTVFIVMGMKMALKREEVEILKLLGATKWYIQWPFVIEGLLYGSIGAFLGWSLTYVTVLYSTPHIIDLVWSLQLLPISVVWMWKLLSVEVVAVGLWCALASAWAVSRYLRRT